MGVRQGQRAPAPRDGGREGERQGLHEQNRGRVNSGASGAEARAGGRTGSRSVRPACLCRRTDFW